MATKKAARAHKHFTIALKIVDGVIQPRNKDFQKQMIPGDTASFQINPPGNVRIHFKPQEAFDGDGRKIPSHRLPFKVGTIKNPDPAKKFKVAHACKSLMQIEAIIDRVLTLCSWDEEGKVLGSTVCTGGGTRPC